MIRECFSELVSYSDMDEVLGPISVYESIGHQIVTAMETGVYPYSVDTNEIDSDPPDVDEVDPLSDIRVDKFDLLEQGSEEYVKYALGLQPSAVSEEAVQSVPEESGQSVVGDSSASDMEQASVPGQENSVV